MALDEPKSEDKIIERGSYKFLLDNQVTNLLEEGGGLLIDFVDELHQKGYMLKLKSTASDCDSGGCSGCEDN